MMGRLKSLSVGDTTLASVALAYLRWLVGLSAYDRS